MADRILNSFAEEPVKHRITLYKSLAFLRMGAPDKTKALFKTLEKPTSETSWSALYYYVWSQISIAENRWFEAAEAISHITALHPKNDEWMPVALYESARIHRKFQQHEVTERVVKELIMLYPESIWAKKAKSLKKDFPIPILMNPSFEEDSFQNRPTSVKNNKPITGWDASPPDRVGLNNKEYKFFGDNGITPEGKNILYLFPRTGTNAVITQEVDGFQIGAKYYLVFRENAQAKALVETPDFPLLSVRLDDTTIVPEHLVRPVENENMRRNEYMEYISKPFTAKKRKHKITFSVRGAEGHSTVRAVLIDHIKLLDWDLKK